MAEEQITTEIGMGELLSKVQTYYDAGYRLVQIGCTGLGDHYEINYSFDKDFVFENIRITVCDGDTIPSISGVYWGAFIYENEIHDLYGLTVEGMNIDFAGTLIKTSVSYPFKNPAPETKGDES